MDCPEALDDGSFWLPKGFEDLQAEQGTSGGIDPADLTITDLTDDERAAFLAALTDQSVRDTLPSAGRGLSSPAADGRLAPMIDDFAKEYLHSDLREIREAMLWKLDGLVEYDIRRPLTSTGTNLLGLVKHLSMWESRYFGEVFDRPFPERLPRWDDTGERGADMWATEHETREEIVARYRRVWEHSDATITTLAIDSPGHVPWWPRPNVRLFNILVHMLTETTRHAGHADILREQLDGSTGTAVEYADSQRDAAFWEVQRAKIEQAAKAVVTKPDHAGSTNAHD